MSDDLVKHSIAELRDLVRCRRHMVDAVQVVADRIEELEAKLAKAAAALYAISGRVPYADDPYDIARTTLAELKEETHE
jgi:ferritin-like protein